MDFGAQIRRRAPDRSVEVHGETKPRRRGAVARRAEAKGRRRVSALHGDGSTWPC